MGFAFRKIRLVFNVYEMKQIECEFTIFFWRNERCVQRNRNENESEKDKIARKELPFRELIGCFFLLYHH